MRKHLFVFLEYSLWIVFLTSVFLGYKSRGVFGFLLGGVLGAFVIGVVMLLISINENMQFLRDEYLKRGE